MTNDMFAAIVLFQFSQCCLLLSISIALWGRR